MNELLTLAVGAHGGLSRWNRFTALTATASITGARWRLKRTAACPHHRLNVFISRCIRAPLRVFSSSNPAHGKGERRKVSSAVRLIGEVHNGLAWFSWLP